MSILSILPIRSTGLGPAIPNPKPRNSGPFLRTPKFELRTAVVNGWLMGSSHGSNQL